MAGVKKKDRAVVAAILAAALVVGLVLVNRGLNSASQAQAARLAAAQYNGGESPSSAPADPPGGQAQAAPDPEPSPSGEAQDEPAFGTQTGQEESGVEETPAPSAGGGAMTLAQLTDWMVNESSGALAADTLAQAESALAAGVGTADDALRRTFAQSQAPGNDQARRNQLEEEAAALGLEYLRCRDILALREESAAFYEALVQTVSGQIQAAQSAAPAETAPAQSAAPAETAPLEEQTGESREDAGQSDENQADGEQADEAQAGEEAAGAAQTERLQADLETAQAALASAQLAVEEAQADLQAATDALNTALGNPIGTFLEVTDTLTAQALPALTADQAARQALEQRSEIRQAAYEVERAEQTLNQLRYEYAPDSPEILEQQAVLQQAQGAYSQTVSQVEAGVRDSLTRLELQSRQLEQRAAALEQVGTSAPQTDYALQSGTDGTWSSNLSQLVEQWTQTESGRAALIEEIARFNLDVICFQHAVGTGCVAAEI